MKIRHLNGEKVIVIERFFRGTDKIKYSKGIDVYNYNEVVQTINHIFKLAEISEVPPREYGDSMAFALEDIASLGHLKIRKISEDHEVIFDDERILTKTKKPILRRLTNSSGMYRGLKMIAGGKKDSMQQ
jgi:hypothetical protein